MDDFIAQLNLASMYINVRHDNVPDIEVTKSISAHSRPLAALSSHCKCAKTGST